MRLKKSKCHFMLPSIEYLGHKISDKGTQPTKGKVRAIVKAPAPNNVTQLKAFLGMLNYYAKFLPKLSSKLAPLYKLLQKKVPWSWGEEQRQAFQEAKEALTSAKVLVHYDPSKKLILSCDASPYGVGAVLSHKLEHPVAFASRSLSQVARSKCSRNTYFSWYNPQVTPRFATHGIPETIVTDNGSVFTSKEFKHFTDMNGINHLTTAPYHPALNGLAETLKTRLKEMTVGNIEDKLACFLFQYRITPHTTTGHSPAELLMGRRP